MGIDACIFFKSRDGLPPEELTAPCGTWGAKIISEYWKEYVPEATHEIDNLMRYYGVGYERGPWHNLAGVLMQLFASRNVESVWYFGDNLETSEPITQEHVLELCKYYMEKGHRPYRGEE